MNNGIIRRMADAAKDLVYPPDLYCICCGKIIDHTRTYRLCDDCIEGMKWIGERTCGRCGKRLSDHNPGGTCFSCREHYHVFDRGYTCTEYGQHERAVVFALKYDGRSDIGDTLGEILYDRMTAEYDADEIIQKYDLILPVPVHISKKRTRGYNQAALIAEGFLKRLNDATKEECGQSKAAYAGDNAGRTSGDFKTWTSSASNTGEPYLGRLFAGEKTDMPVMDDTILIRARETHVMRSLTPDQRRENIRGAFEVRPRRLPDIEGRSILLIDDIYTTGATIDEIARVLKEPWNDKYGVTHHGAARVDCLTFAAGADMIKAD